MKSILAVTTGLDSDAAVYRSLHPLAARFRAHVTGLHASVDLKSVQHVALELGTAGVLEAWFDDLKTKQAHRIRMARAAHDAYCAEHRIALADTPRKGLGVSASWRAVHGEPVATLAREARGFDLVAMPPCSEGGFTVSEVGEILLSCGRPILLAPRDAKARSYDTVAIAWKDTAEAARATTAAMPLLAKAKRVLVMTAGEDDDTHIAPAKELCRTLLWNGIDAELHDVPAGKKQAPDALVDAALEMGARLLVMGAYGRSRMREVLFGGFTRRMLNGVALPVMLCH